MRRVVRVAGAATQPSVNRSGETGSIVVAQREKLLSLFRCRRAACGLSVKCRTFDRRGNRMSPMPFDALPLHDAVLTTVTLNWAAAICEVRIHTSGPIHTKAGPYILRFHRVRRVDIPRFEPWGPSGSVNSQSRQGDLYQIEIQSGDTMTVTAESFEFVSDEAVHQAADRQGR